MKTAIVVGCGPSVEKLRLADPKPPDVLVIACNRAIELVEADYWLWVDAIHYERSKWHANARRTARVAVDHHRHHEATLWFQPRVVLPCGDEELYLWGGTLTPAAHLAVRLGADRVVFVGCDALDGRDRYHTWDGAPFTPGERAIHDDHLQRTGTAIKALAALYRDVEFLDGTQAPRHLGLPPAELDGLFDGQRGEALGKDQCLPGGYGKLVAVTGAGRDGAVLWLQDSIGTIRAIRMQMDFTSGLSLAMRGQAQIART